MTEEQIKHTSKITEFARNKVKQSNYPKELQEHIIATCMVVVTEATKEWQENEEAKIKRLEKHIKNMEKLIPKTCDVCVGWGCHARCVDCYSKDNWKLKE